MGDTNFPFARVDARIFGTFIAAGAIATALFGYSGTAAASGFELKEQSAAALGNAFAGATAGAEDVTYMYFNPAGLTRHGDNQVAAVLSYIAPKSETDNATVGAAIGGESTSGDAGVNAFVPVGYGMWSVSEDLKIAVGINAPFGLKTEYTQTWQGRLHAVDSELLTVNVNPVVAYRVNENLSVGIGLQIQYADATLSQMTGAGPGTLGELTGDDWGFGVNLGILYEASEATRFGLGYRSRVKHTIKGTFTSPGPTVIDASADLTLPDIVTIGAYHDYSESFAVMAEIGWTNWSTFDEIRVKDAAGTPFSITPENWDDSWWVSLGATWRLDEKWKLRGGVAWNQSPIPDAFRTPRIPDEDRTWIAVGAGYNVSDSFTIDAGYTHLFVKDSNVNLPAGYTTPALPSLTADYENSVDIVTIQGVFRF